MNNFLADFQVFLNYVMSGIGQIYDWFSSTILGEIMLFSVLILVFLYIIHLIIDFKD